jgi:chemotaxis protein MotB
VQKAVGGYFQDPVGAGRLMGSTKAGNGDALSVKRDDMDELKRRIEAAMSKEIQNFEKLKQNVKITITEEGLRVELLESEKSVFFESGRPEPTEQGAEVFNMLGHQLGALPNPVVIEGHTDSAPFGREDYSNWELSADRANTVRRLMHRQGLRADQVVQVRGFADQHLRKPEDPRDASNRRVSVIIRFRDLAPASSSESASKPTSSGHS